METRAHERGESCYVTVPSAFGLLAVVWHEGAFGPTVARVLLPDARTRPERRIAAEFGELRVRTAVEISRLAADLQSFLCGNAVPFDLGSVDLDACTRFKRAVLVAESGIPRGSLSTYGRLARHLGRPGAARAVGRALATNPFPIVVPCHRTIAADGSLGGFQGGLGMKRALLRLEGVQFGPDGRVSEARFVY